MRFVGKSCEYKRAESIFDFYRICKNLKCYLHDFILFRFSMMRIPYSNVLTKFTQNTSGSLLSKSASVVLMCCYTKVVDLSTSDINHILLILQSQ